jgi:hypothetical protein
MGRAGVSVGVSCSAVPPLPGRPAARQGTAARAARANLMPPGGEGGLQRFS